jgi:glycosyltransferase involved in cell wall biosynthesis
VSSVSSVESLDTRVSIIVCTYSEDMYDHFVECVGSLLSQSYQNIHVICVVDGDSNYFKRIKKEQEKWGDRIELSLNQKNLGALESRNRGAEKAKGDILAFIDDDAVAHVDWIQELVHSYEKGILSVAGKIEPLWKAEKPCWFPEEFYWLLGVTHKEGRNTFGSNLSFRRSAFRSIKGFRVDIGGRKGKGQLQGGEIELCERMKQRFKRDTGYNSKAVVYHKIFEERMNMGYLVQRSFWQGYSKAVMQSLGGSIKHEKDFLGYIVLDATRTRLSRVLRGSREDLECFLSMWLFTCCVGTGYLVGKTRGIRRRVRDDGRANYGETL